MSFHNEFTSSQALRQSLKRGLARQALADAAAADADLPGVFRLAATIGPNRKALERGAARLQVMRGVVAVALAAEGLVVTVRSLREVITRAGATDLFAEKSVLYTRIAVLGGLRNAGFQIQRASLSAHALERMVERSAVALDRRLLAGVDAEARVLMRRMAAGGLVEDGGDIYAATSLPGAWAGSLDLSGLEADWGLAYPSQTAKIPVYSVRTFLGVAEMRPGLRQLLVKG